LTIIEEWKKEFSSTLIEFEIPFPPENTYCTRKDKDQDLKLWLATTIKSLPFYEPPQAEALKELNKMENMSRALAYYALGQFSYGNIKLAEIKRVLILKEEIEELKKKGKYSK
jgi:hypothetical protein